MKYFVSDTHFQHKKIVEITNRGVETTQEQHTEWLINLWNKQVTDNDQVYLLGDVSFATKYDQIKEVFQRLNGQIFVVKGNHDRTAMLDKLLDDHLIQAWYQYKEIKIGTTDVCLFHFPISSWNKQGYGSIMLHGHCHGSFTPEKGKILDVGIDSAYNIFGEHRLFSEDDVVEYMNSRKININDHHKDNTEYAD